MDLKTIEYICAIAETKTISQAAKNLFISQPALSHALAKAEQELGVQLFQRTGKIMIPTNAGMYFIREGRTILQMHTNIMEHLKSLNRYQPSTLRFGISSFYSKYYLPMLFLYYEKHFPQIRLEVIEQPSIKLEERLLSGDLRLAFMPTEPPRTDLIYQSIYIEEIMIALSKKHPANAHAINSSSKSYLDITLLKNERFISLVPDMKFSSMSQRIFKHFGFSPNIIYESTNWDTVCMMVAQDIGVSLLPSVLLEKHLLEPNFYSIPGIDSTRAYSAVYVQGQNLSYQEMMLIDIFTKLLQTQSHPDKPSNTSRDLLL